MKKTKLEWRLQGILRAVYSDLPNLSGEEVCTVLPLYLLLRKDPIQRRDSPTGGVYLVS
jgi:hypothetical protein